MDAYNHTCAVCGVRIVTPEGRTAVAAAHIVPWSISHNDDPRNGMALCGLHHWMFDQGLIGIATDYHIQVSPIVATDDEATAPVWQLVERTLQLPTQQLIWPAKVALRWHLENIFRADIPPRLL